MINLETQKKLKKLGIFKRDCCIPKEISRFKGCPFYVLPVAKRPDMLRISCNKCQYLLPDPTTDKLIEAIDGSRRAKWGIERQKENGSWLVWFEIYMGKSITAKGRQILPGNNLKEALATALIWLYEKGE